MKSQTETVLLLVAVAGFVGYSSSTTVQEYLRVTYNQKQALDKFREVMLPHLYTDYMKQDIYLIRWLRAKDFNVENAKEYLLENLRWRKENNMDTISSEDWSDMQEDYPYEITTHDKQGRPVGAVPFGSWNVRRAAISGKMPRLIRYMAKLLEETAHHIEQDQYKGKNVTEWKILMNIEGFTVVQNGCPACLPAYTSFVNAYQNYYPGYTDAFILINTPNTFKTVLRVVTPLFSEKTKKVLKIFGTNKKEWMAYLDKEISKEERRPEYGGTKLDKTKRGMVSKMLALVLENI